MITQYIVIVFVTVTAYSYKVNMISEGWMPVSREYVLNLQKRNWRPNNHIHTIIDNTIKVVQPQLIQRNFLASIQDVVNIEEKNKIKSSFCDGAGCSKSEEFPNQQSKVEKQLRKARKNYAIEENESYKMENTNQLTETHWLGPHSQENSHQMVSEKSSAPDTGYIFDIPVNEGHELSRENPTNFTEVLTNFLEKHNINSNDYLDNYAKSRNGYNRNGKTSNFYELHPDHFGPAHKYSELYGQPLNRILAILFTKYGYYFPKAYKNTVNMNLYAARK